MKNTGLQSLDIVVFLIYFVAISTYGVWIYRKKAKKEESSRDYFLAEGSLTFWAIGASLIASNISAEHFIGMSGSGFAIGMAISSYEWMSAAALVVVAIFFVPVYLKNKIYTMPQFLRQRYNPLVATTMAVFWLLLYVFVNLTSILYLGALALEVTAGVDFTMAIVALACFAIIITIGGMKVIGYTDVIQVVVLVIGGLITTYLAMDLVAEHFHKPNVISAFGTLKEQADSHFHMILNKDNPYYKDLPGLSVIIGSMWINNLNYWGCNQYIIQRTLGADLKTARTGILFAAFLKLMIPLIVVIPGVAAFVLHQNGMFQTEMMDAAGNLKPDHAYPVLLDLLPSGLKGIAFAALTAAIVASLAGKANSISTIFTLDIYKQYIKPEASEKHLVRVGRMTVWGAMAIAVIIAPKLKVLDQAYQFIQEYSSFITPGVFAIFFLGMFWKKTTGNAALLAAVMTIPLSVVFKFSMGDIPFLDRMGIIFLILVAMIVVVSLVESGSKDNPKAIEIQSSDFTLNKSFMICSILICGILAALYSVFW
ncbi:solute:Na+ symporter, SSS family [Pseudarcicella hirudinis]|uniref:Solute:Na+ symporter, SSS family n=1 Tax=Pseudarcicella hirudinis TaxID=1079859 RepID=A0A1I5TET9_9BACT|nr:sodium/sugar symporter [Pseudarcicella hirudinis]SFP81549.1 solute:Na+ symporter, SSS family [Pseudarcicella hirudinis]